jgi:hypothetical protein
MLSKNPSILNQPLLNTLSESVKPRKSIVHGTNSHPSGLYIKMRRETRFSRRQRSRIVEAYEAD